jgi:hypothetical protein
MSQMRLGGVRVGSSTALGQLGHAGYPLRRDDSCRLTESAESLMRVFPRATKVAAGHAGESVIISGPWGVVAAARVEPRVSQEPVGQ